MRSWFSWCRAASASRSMSLSRALWRHSVRAAFLSAAILYATSSMLSDMEYGLGMKTREIKYMLVASRLFPLLRTRRSGAAYLVAINADIKDRNEIKWALRYDPYAADLWYGLARMQLKGGDQIGYNASLTRLKELTPGVNYSVVSIR